MQSTEDALLSIVRSRRVRRWFRAIVLFLALLVVIRSSIVDVSDVPSRSMMPLIEPGNRILIDKLAYDLKIPLTRIHLLRWGDPRSGDVVVFDSPKTGLRLVKRVVAVGGDRVSVVGNRLCINGQWCAYRSERHLLIEQAGNQSRPILARLGSNGLLATAGPTTVPANTFYMMGDNRDDSADSRVIGPVPRSAIIGRVRRVF